MCTIIISYSQKRYLNKLENCLLRFIEQTQPKAANNGMVFQYNIFHCIHAIAKLSDAQTNFYNFKAKVQ